MDILTDAVALQKIEESRRLGHDINVRVSRNVNLDTAIMTIVTDDKVTAYEISRQLACKEGF